VADSEPYLTVAQELPFSLHMSRFVAKDCFFPLFIAILPNDPVGHVFDLHTNPVIATDPNQLLFLLGHVESTARG
jgi:hypothetical protein